MYHLIPFRFVVERQLMSFLLFSQPFRPMLAICWFLELRPLILLSEALSGSMALGFEQGFLPLVFLVLLRLVWLSQLGRLELVLQELLELEFLQGMVFIMVRLLQFLLKRQLALELLFIFELQLVLALELLSISGQQLVLAHKLLSISMRQPVLVRKLLSIFEQLLELVQEPLSISGLQLVLELVQELLSISMQQL